MQAIRILVTLVAATTAFLLSVAALPLLGGQIVAQSQWLAAHPFDGSFQFAWRVCLLAIHLLLIIPAITFLVWLGRVTAASFWADLNRAAIWAATQDPYASTDTPEYSVSLSELSPSFRAPEPDNTPETEDVTAARGPRCRH